MLFSEVDLNQQASHDTRMYVPYCPAKNESQEQGINIQYTLDYRVQAQDIP